MTAEADFVAGRTMLLGGVDDVVDDVFDDDDVVVDVVDVDDAIKTNSPFSRVKRSSHFGHCTTPVRLFSINGYYKQKSKINKLLLISSVVLGD
jgi:hypothetical protein